MYLEGVTQTFSRTMEPKFPPKFLRLSITWDRPSYWLPNLYLYFLLNLWSFCEWLTIVLGQHALNCFNSLIARLSEESLGKED